MTEKIGASYDAGSWVKGSPGRAEEKQSEIATKGSRVALNKLKDHGVAFSNKVSKRGEIKIITKLLAYQVRGWWFHSLG